MQGSFLKKLRETRKISRRELSRRTRLSTYQIEGLEGHGTQSFFGRVLLYMKALGYKSNDFIRLMEFENYADFISHPRGSLSEPRSEILFKDGVKLFTYLEESGFFLGELHLAKGKSLEREKIRASGLMVGIVREGTLVVDMFIKQFVYKKDYFFIFPEHFPFEFVNADSFSSTAVLIFSTPYPR